VKDSRSNESPLFAEGRTRVRTVYSMGHRVKVSFSYYVNFDLFCLMTIPSNCKVRRINAVDAYETVRKKIVDFKNMG